MLRGSLLRGSIAGALVGTSLLIAFAASPPAGAAPRSSCGITGNVSPTVVNRGQNVTITAAVRPDGGPCNARRFEIRGGPFVLWTENLTSGFGSHTITVGAFDGLSAVTVKLDTGQSSQIGSVTVLSPTPTRTVIRRTVTVPAPRGSSSAAASSAAAAASRSAAARASRAAATRVRTSTVTSTAFPSDTTAPSTEAGPASDTPASGTASATGFSVNVRTDPTGGASIPVGPLLLALLVLAGFVAAAARLIYTHTHEEIRA